MGPSVRRDDRISGSQPLKRVYLQGGGTARGSTRERGCKGERERKHGRQSDYRFLIPSAQLQVLTEQ